MHALTAVLILASTPYTPDAALADVLSGPLELVGRGPWFGMERWESCVYRNAKVLVVDVYCAKEWPRAFSLRVFSPTRGRLNLYLESEKPIGELTRDRYDDALWKLESEPPPPRDRLPTVLRPGMSFEELRDYEEARYQLYLPGCYIAGATARCHRDLEAARAVWAAAAEPFWKRPGRRWSRVVEMLRALAQKHGT